jgi:hypothetical protein
MKTERMRTSTKDILTAITEAGMDGLWLFAYSIVARS